MGRPPLGIGIAPKDQAKLAKLLGGSVYQVRAVLNRTLEKGEQFLMV
jgi:hypothetical protein